MLHLQELFTNNFQQKSHILEVKMHEFLIRVIKKVQYVLGLYLNNISDEEKGENGIDKKGGYFTLFIREDNRVLTTTLIGDISDEKAEKSRAFSPEKALRLRDHPEHNSSHQSRNLDEGKWGGAIATIYYILSFSGLPELWDEALMLLAAILLDWMTPDQAFAIAEQNHNPKFALIYEAHWRLSGKR